MPPGGAAPRRPDGPARGPSPRAGDRSQGRRAAGEVEGSDLVPTGLARGGQHPRNPPGLRPRRGCRGPWSRSWRRTTSWRSRSGSRARSQRLPPLPALAGEDHPAQAGRSRVPGRSPDEGPPLPRIPSYDALLDEYEPGAHSRRPGRPFRALDASWPLVAAIVEAA